MINSTDFMQDIVKVLAATKDRAEKAAIIAELIISELPESVAQMVRECAILHWFDQPFIEAMRKARLIDAMSKPNPKAYHVFGNKDIYEQIITLPFVEKLPWGFTLQDLTREGLLKRYAATQPDLLASAARLAAPIYEARHNDKADAEALFCYIIEGNKVASKNLMHRLSRQARERGDEQYINNLWEMVNEAWQMPSVEPFPLMEADFTQKEIEMLLVRPTKPTSGESMIRMAKASAQVRDWQSSSSKILKEEVLVKAYKDVREGKITDPLAIREIAANFHEIASDPQVREMLSFDAERAAQNLYEQANRYEKSDAEQETTTLQMSSLSAVEKSAELEMVLQQLQLVHNQLAQVKTLIAKAVAETQRLQQLSQEKRAEANMWLNKRKQALQQGQGDVERRALTNYYDLNKQAQRHRQAQKKLNQLVATWNSTLRQLEARRSEIEKTLELLVTDKHNALIQQSAIETLKASEISRLKEAIDKEYKTAQENLSSSESQNASRQLIDRHTRRVIGQVSKSDSENEMEAIIEILRTAKHQSSKSETGPSEE